jgi:hypothetical protein
VIALDQGTETLLAWLCLETMLKASCIKEQERRFSYEAMSNRFYLE